MDWRLILEFLVVAGSLAMGGVGLGLWGAVGLLVLVVGFDVAPANIPGEVLLIVLTVIMAASAMEVAGGIDFLVRVAERIIRKNPKQITIIAPLVTYGFTFAAGTGHIVYPLLPVIYEVAHENGIRPERPMAIATIASQQAITASPVSAATAAIIGLLAPHQIGLVQILMICVPSTLIAVFVASLVQLRVGKELKDDLEYQKRLASGEVESPRAASAPLKPGAVAKLESARTVAVESNASLNPSATIKLETPLAADPQANASLKRGAMTSALIFLAGVVLVVLAGIFPELRTVPGVEKPIVLSMPFAIAIVMLAVAAVILTVTKAPVAEVPKCKTCQSGITAIIGILGLAWLGDTFINANREAIIGGLSSMASAAPWTFAFGLFFASVLLYSQAATTRALMPLGLSLGIWPHLLIGMFPAVNGYFLIPNYGTIIAAINFDRSGTTRIGKYVINHSFLVPGLVTNDAYPTEVKLGVVLTLRDTVSALRELQTGHKAKAAEFADVLKMGRTENQDAVPMTLGQEFGAYAVMIGDGIRHLEQTSAELLKVNMGATAIGTGINSPPGYAELCTQRLAEISGLRVTLAGDLVEATQDSGEFALMSSVMKTAAVQLPKICNDLRWLSSGPRCGLYELRLPAMQPGSSIMPGKVNPVIPEVVSQVCFQIFGADVAISMACEASELELNMAEPIIAFNLLFGLTLLRNAAIILNTRCIAGIEANRERCLAYVQNSIGLVTALNPVLGYEKSVAIAKEALVTNRSVYELVIERDWLTQAQLDDILKPESMIHPRRLAPNA